MSDDFHPIAQTAKVVQDRVASIKFLQELTMKQEAEELEDMAESLQEELVKEKKKELPGSPQSTVGKAQSAGYLQALQKQKANLEEMVKLSSGGFAQGANSAESKYQKQLNEVKAKINAVTVPLVD